MGDPSGRLTIGYLLDDMERHSNCALKYVDEIDKYDSKWHPNAKKGVSLTLTSEVKRLVGDVVWDIMRCRDVLKEQLDEIDGLKKRIKEYEEAKMRETYANRNNFVEE